MSTTNKVNAITDEYSELKNEFISNCQKSLENLTELNNICVTVFNNTSSVDDIACIKEEWIKSSNKIDKLKDSIQTLQSEKNTIIKKIESIINKKTKTTASDAKNITTCQEEWCQVSSQMTVLNGQLETFNKDRATIIKKAESYFSKLDSVKTKKSNKKSSKKVSGKDVDVDVGEEVTVTCKKETTNNVVTDKKLTAAEKKAIAAAEKKTAAAEKKTAAAEKKTAAVEKKNAAAEKKTAAAEKKTVTSGKKTTAVEKKEIVKAKPNKSTKTTTETVQNKLQLDSDSDSDTDSDSESDTDSNLSSVDSGSDSDSDSDSSDDEE
jgi:hypothetical protein